VDAVGGIVVKIVVLELHAKHVVVVYGCVKVINLNHSILIVVNVALLLDLVMPVAV
jgi:hypothetical protein